MTDLRDGHVYRTVTIGDQIWMAENLNYAYPGKTFELDSSSFCESDPGEYVCDKYGRLYLWSSAFDSAGFFSTNSKGCGVGKICTPRDPVRGTCPKGWHLPMNAEWGVLLSTVAGDTQFGSHPWYVDMYTAPVLKSVDGWNGKGTDDFGFSVLPATGLDNGTTWIATGYSSSFWTSSGGHMSMVNYSDIVFLSTGAGIGFSATGSFIRCIKDSESEMAFDGAPELPDIVDKMDVTTNLTGPCKTDSTDDCEYGILIDDRDGKTYKTVTIGTYTWMAENLDYETENSFCFNDSVENCAKYGRLYTWSAAIDSAGVYGKNGEGCGNGKICTPVFPIRGVCPAGWHLPHRAEWYVLITYVDPDMGDKGAIMLKSPVDWDAVNGQDAYGFCVYPAGFRGEFSFVGFHDMAEFWCSDELTSDHASIVKVNGRNTRMDDKGYQPCSLNVDEKCNALSVRCVKDY